MSLAEELPTLLPQWLPQQRWFAAKGRPVQRVTVATVTSLLGEGEPLLGAAREQYVALGATAWIRALDHEAAGV